MQSNRMASEAAARSLARDVARAMGLRCRAGEQVVVVSPKDGGKDYTKRLPRWSLVDGLGSTLVEVIYYAERQGVYVYAPVSERVDDALLEASLTLATRLAQFKDAGKAVELLAGPYYTCRADNYGPGNYRAVVAVNGTRYGWYVPADGGYPLWITGDNLDAKVERMRSLRASRA